MFDGKGQKVGSVLYCVIFAGKKRRQTFAGGLEIGNDCSGRNTNLHSHPSVFSTFSDP